MITNRRHNLHALARNTKEIRKEREEGGETAKRRNGETESEDKAKDKKDHEQFFSCSLFFEFCPFAKAQDRLLIFDLPEITGRAP